MTTTDIINIVSESAASGDIRRLEDLHSEISQILITDEERGAYLRLITTMIELIEAA